MRFVFFFFLFFAGGAMRAQSIAGVPAPLPDTRQPDERAEMILDLRLRQVLHDSSGKTEEVFEVLGVRKGSYAVPVFRINADDFFVPATDTVTVRTVWLERKTGPPIIFCIPTTRYVAIASKTILRPFIIQRTEPLPVITEQYLDIVVQLADTAHRQKEDFEPTWAAMLTSGRYNVVSVTSGFLADKQIDLRFFDYDWRRMNALGDIRVHVKRTVSTMGGKKAILYEVVSFL